MARALSIHSRIHILKRLEKILFAGPYFALMTTEAKRTMWLQISAAVLPNVPPTMIIVLRRKASIWRGLVNAAVVFIACVFLGCIVAWWANRSAGLPESGTGLNPCGTTPHCPTWNDNNN